MVCSVKAPSRVLFLSVKADKLKDITTPSVANMLQGKIAGAVVVPTSGRPGDGVSIRVRGIGSIRGNVEPLWVIDGVVGASSADLNPNDIESISILKDGSATALYGSRGANGVIQVTTKRALRVLHRLICLLSSVYLSCRKVIWR